MYDTTFDEKKAGSQFKDYLRKGPRKDTGKLLEAIRQLPVEGRTLLDIGGGIGALVFELLEAGMEQATHIELSNAYRRVFLAEVERRNYSEKVVSRQGDFTDLHEEITPADLVALDKVICCYEDYEQLVRRSLAKAERWYAYSIPRNVWWVRLAHWLEKQVKKLKGKTNTFHLHPTEQIERLAEEAGFRKIEQRHQLEWLIVVFEKRS